MNVDDEITDGLRTIAAGGSPVSSQEARLRGRTIQRVRTWRRFGAVALSVVVAAGVVVVVGGRPESGLTTTDSASPQDQEASYVSGPDSRSDPPTMSSPEEDAASKRAAATDDTDEESGAAEAEVLTTTSAVQVGDVELSGCDGQLPAADVVSAATIEVNRLAWVDPDAPVVNVAISGPSAISPCHMLIVVSRPLTDSESTNLRAIAGEELATVLVGEMGRSNVGE